MQPNISAHAINRARQRNIHPDLIFLVANEGRPLRRNWERLLLSKSDVLRLRQENRIDSRLLQRAENGAPLACVLVDNTIHTIFRVQKAINHSRPKRIHTKEKKCRATFRKEMQA